MNGSLAPFSNRFNPNRGPFVVEYVVIKIVIEFSITLQQSEALWIVIDKGVCRDMRLAYFAPRFYF